MPLIWDGSRSSKVVFFHGCLEKDLFDLGVEGALTDFRAEYHALTSGGSGCGVKVETVIQTVLTRVLDQAASRGHSDGTTVEVVRSAAADVASVLGNHIDVVEQRCEASVDELGRHRHVAE